MGEFYLDLVADGAVISDGEGRVVAMNGAGRRMLALPFDLDVTGRPLDEVLMLTDHDGRTWVEVNEPYRGLGTRTGVPEQVWVLPDGSEALVVARIHRPAVDQPIDRVAVSLRSGRGRERLDRERSDLVATVAHELRSPLTGVKGFVQAMLNRWDKLSDDQKKLMLTTVNSDSDRLSALITELLDVARLDTGRLSLYPRPVDLHALVQRVVASVGAGTNRELVVVVTDELPEVVVDPDKTIQVFTNLVENAVRHGEGTVRITLSPMAGNAPFPGIRVHVDDQGEGIAPEVRRRIFTKFWKHGVRGGSGLGLYLVNGLVRANGGLVTVTDAPGGGARITIELPSEPASADLG
ncbi:sensor histidine kinase [Nocardioides alcanivorans]|uniref:sensor histidine kinase n=1 Tax=Nocardioides alcanivorans TaxID=2897352 RepID=UPI001F2BDFA3|nr:PAS domain-containing sensor histidine kinase [Nocardioides alcanivorans]